MAEPIVTNIKVVRQACPLRQPYHLAMGTLESFDSLFVRVELNSGQWGIGETVPLAGYGWEDADQSHSFLIGLAEKVQSRLAAEIWQKLRLLQTDRPFAVTAILTGLEAALYGWPEIPVPFGVPLAALADFSAGSVESTISRLSARGYTTFKIKLGAQDIDSDLSLIKELHDLKWDRGRLRFDANQAFDFNQALALGQAMEGLPVEFFEQPLAKDAWDEMVELTTRLKTPTMLDESIWNESDINRVAKTGAARAVKLKLMKCGSMAHTQALLDLARKAGLGVVLGNGVAGPLSCHQEAVLHHNLNLTTAGEMNGLFKLRDSWGQNAVHPVPGGLEVLSARPPWPMHLFD